jgi:hypothetical protein|tara:strand:- start:797 stop:1066 length:270 start_codon:yes stop_codon:yes gene_type:complete
MPLNQPALYAALYAAFRRQSTKPGPGKIGVEAQLAQDISRAVHLFVMSGTVMTGTTHIGLGIGVTVPHPYIIPVFTVTAGAGTGVGVVV